MLLFYIPSMCQVNDTHQFGEFYNSIFNSDCELKKRLFRFCNKYFNLKKHMYSFCLVGCDRGITELFTTEY